MSDEENPGGSMAECGACRELIPIDSAQCPACGVSFSGVSDEALGECGACNKLVPIDSTKCPECGVVFVADDVVDVLRSWLAKTGISVLQLFERFDVDGNGVIDSNELRNGLLDLNLADLPPSQVERLVEVIDENGDGEIDLGELEVIIAGEQAQEMGYAEGVLDRVMSSFRIENKEEFLAFASKMDEDENRYLTESELKKAAAMFVQNEGKISSQVIVEDDVEATTEEPIESIEEDDGEHIEHEVDEQDDVSHEAEEEGEVHEDDDAEVHEDGDTEVEEETEQNEEDFEEQEATDEDFDVEDEEGEWESEDEDTSSEVDFIPGVHKKHAFEKLIALMDEEGVSVSRFFNNLDKNGDGKLSHEELLNALQNELEGVLSEEDISDLMENLDQDGDGKIDLHEFIESLEEFDDQIEAAELKAKKEKEFPTAWQKRFMSKSWNDIMYPIMHTVFGLLIVVLLVNGLVGPVDGSGGLVAQETELGYIPYTTEEGLPGSIPDGTIYPCDKKIQVGECANSLTPLAGKSSSMPKGFYWDGILGLILSFAGLISSITLHFVLAPSWRARMRAMKEVQDDHADARDFDEAFVSLGELMVERNLTIREVFEAMDADGDHKIDGPEFQKGLESLAGDSLSPQHVQAILYSLDEDGSGTIDPVEFIDAILALDMGIRSDYEERNEDDQGDTIEDDFQIGDFIGLILYDEDGEEEEEVYGTIIEFDDDEGTVIIEEDETGDEITGYTEDAFFPEE